MFLEPDLCQRRDLAIKKSLLVLINAGADLRTFHSGRAHTLVPGVRRHANHLSGVRALNTGGLYSGTRHWGINRSAAFQKHSKLR